MTYYKILKERRLALQLSIQDIYMQTGLDKDFIQAIEENDLDAFKGDLSYIRYFTKKYCEIIGVNYEAITNDVEANLLAYQASLTKEQENEKEAVEEASHESPKKVHQAKSKKRKPYSKNKWVRMVQKMNRSKYAHIYQIVAAGLCILLVLSIINAGLSWRSNQRLAAEEKARQSEIKKKEKETAQLANQKDSTDSSSSSNVKLTATDKDNNVYELSGVVGDSNEVSISITLPEDSTVAVYKDDELVTDNADKVYSGTFSQTVKVDSACMLQIEIGTLSSNKIRINGKSLSFSKTNWTEGSSAVIYLDVLDEDGQSAQDTSDSSDASTYYSYDESY